MPSRQQVRLVHIDGALPNLALMKLSHFHRRRGDAVTLSRSVQPTLFETPRYDVVYGSAIFKKSRHAVESLRHANPQAVIGGTGSGPDAAITVEQTLGLPQYERYDYSIYPEFPWSLGFTQRGCRLNCPFCVVPRKEGKPRSVNTIADILQPGRPKAVILLDNDFFGQPREQWQARIAELVEHDVKVNFHQGVNVRAVTDETALALASVNYRDQRFNRRRLHMAWDNIGHERAFFRGVERLQAAGIPTRHMVVYMLVGFAPGETMAAVMHRHRRLKEAGCHPYPMVYQPLDESDHPANDLDHDALKRFQRWVIRRYDEFVPWEKYGNPYRPNREDACRNTPLLKAAQPAAAPTTWPKLRSA